MCCARCWNDIRVLDSNSESCHKDDVNSFTAFVPFVRLIVYNSMPVYCSYLMLTERIDEKKHMTIKKWFRRIEDGKWMNHTGKTITVKCISIIVFVNSTELALQFESVLYFFALKNWIENRKLFVAF